MHTTKPCVLLVNDDPDQLDLMAAAIGQDEVEVRSFYSAETALNHIRTDPRIDLIVTDLNMPGMDGWQFCHHLRSPEFPQTNRTPILVVSATFSGENPEAILNDVGANAFLSAPYRPKQLRELARELIAGQFATRESVVLLIQGQEAERHALAQSFATHRYRVLEAVNEEEAVALFQMHRPNLIVIDHGTPGVDSLSLLAQFKKAAASDDPSAPSAIPTVIVTASEWDTALASRLTRQGADACIRRPYDINDLLNEAMKASRSRALSHIESLLETQTREALRNAERIRRLNEVFVSLGSDHGANIQTLTQITGELLGADCAIYCRVASSKLDVAACWQGPKGIPSLSQAQDSLWGQTANQSASEPLVIRHLQERELAHTDPSVRSHGLQTYVGCPVPVEGRQAGSIGLLYTHDLDPSPGDLHTLQLLARALGQQEQIHQRNRELATLNQVSQIITSALSLDEMLVLLRDKARDMVNAQACSIALVAPQTGELVFRLADGPSAAQIVGRRLQPGQGIAGWVAQAGQSLLVPDAYADPRFYAQIDDLSGFVTHAVLCTPLIAKDRTIGVLELFNQHPFTENDLHLIESVAAQVASVIENTRLHEETRKELAERTRAEKALQESESRQRAFIESSPDMIFVKDAELRYLLVNQTNIDLLGPEPTEIIGKTDLELMPEEAAQRRHQNNRQAIASQQVVISEERFRDRVYEIRDVPIFDDEGKLNGVAGIIRDITERRLMEQQRIQRRKEESILNLAGGIAHDFNNALVGIVGNIGLLRMDLPLTDEVTQTLNAMENSAQRIADLTRQLLIFAGAGLLQSHPISLNTAVKQAIADIRSRMPPSITLQCSQACDLWPALGDPGQIAKLLTNLLTNAYEAMAKQGGTLTIVTENAERESWTCKSQHQHPAGRYVHIAIGDTGEGMDEQAQEHLFEPFFSTKFTGRGMGLPEALGIVRSHKGCIQVESKPSQGTTVHVYLPSSAQPELSLLHPSGDQKGNILVVEDDSIVRNLAQRVLSRQGYTVLLAEDGEQALQLYRQYHSEIDLVLLDVGLPGLGGAQVLELLRAQDPDVRVLLSSGYDETSAIADVPAGEKTGFIPKPYSLQTLSNQVEAMLKA